MNTQYDVEEWATGTTRGRQVFNYSYRMLGTELKGWKLLKVVSMQEGADLRKKAYLWQSTSDPEREMVRIDVTEHHNWRRAQQSLHEHLTNSMRPDIPRGTKKLAQLGDVVFAGREPRTDAAGVISLTLGNVFVTVSSVGEKTVDVSEIAARVEALLSEPPTKSQLAKGRARARTPKMAAVKENQPYLLIKELSKAAPRGEWLKVIVSDGELRREGDALIYVSPQGGKKDVRTFTFSGK
jgi:hypothetical protein